MSSKKRKYKNKRLSEYLDDDPDIAEQIRKHGEENVRVVYNSET